MKTNYVIFNMSCFRDWQNGIVNRNRFIIDELYKNESTDKILLVDMIPFTFKKTIKSRFLLDPKDCKIIKGGFGYNLYSLNKRTYIYSSVEGYFSEVSMMHNLTKILYELDMHEYTLWSYNPMFVRCFDLLAPNKSIFDTVDNWSEHASYVPYKKRIKENYQHINRNASHIFTVSKSLNKMFTSHAKVLWVPNGVDMKHFSKETNTIPEDIKNIPKPIIGYLGTIQERFDFDLIKDIAREHSDKSIVLVGPVWKSVENKMNQLLKEFKNIYALGRKQYNETPLYIKQFDVCIIPHIINKFIQSTDPMKLYEYLACGKPVVTTAGAGVDQFRDVIHIAYHSRQFISYIETAINNSPKHLIQTRKDSIDHCDWKTKLNSMLQFISY